MPEPVDGILNRSIPSPQAAEFIGQLAGLLEECVNFREIGLLRAFPVHADFDVEHIHALLAKQRLTAAQDLQLEAFDVDLEYVDMSVRE